MKMAFAAVCLALAAAIAAPARALAAEPVVLKFGFYPPVTSYVNTEGLTPWIDKVDSASRGTIEIKLFAGPTLGSERNMYDRTLADVAQIGYSTLGPLASQFPRTQVSGLPLLSSDTGISAVALWRLYQEGLLGHEFDKVKVLALFNFPTAYLHTNKTIRTLDDLKGLKLAVSSRVSADVMVALGASPVTLAPTEFYESLQRGVVDGAVVSWTAVKTFKLDEVTKYHLEVPLGEAPVFVFMNKSAYAGLPSEAKHAIDEYSGEAFSKTLGANNEAQGRAESKKVAGEPGHTVTRLSPDQYTLWQARIDPVVAAWAKQTPDGAKVFAAYREELKKLGATN
jgi:TRAP-type C4-dicarboxylate transport system substrate-binding protein